ncbi:hypothetical protein C6497_01940 [Candidatus Poribacteria bacterium]|nr:MAG: hypothetical protein C6497_01940 [Candidatus Poribacteria bacterium]
MAIYRLDGEVNSDCKLIHAKETSLEYEGHIEDWLENSPWALIQDENIIWIDRQPSAKDEEGTIYPDLFGVDIDGNLVIVEFKRGKTPKDVVAQLLEYAAWADNLSSEEIHKIAEAYFEKTNIYHGRDFNDIFSEFYDLPENEELPLLNRKLRLFIVAGEIPKRISGVCQYLRNSHSVDISCVLVSVFETETGERLVSMEAIIGDDNQPDLRPLPPDGVPTPQWTGDKGVREVVKDAVDELTNGDKTIEFSIKDVRTLIQNKIPEFKNTTIGAQIAAGCVNHNSREWHPSAKHNYYWRIKRGKYQLYDSQNDKLEE